MAIDRKLNISNSKIFLKRLLKTVGYSRTMDLLLTGRDIKSKEAFECGLANRVVACGSSMKAPCPHSILYIEIIINIINLQQVLVKQ